ncbi:MAG: class I SAM-dependent methyltransferase [Bacteroidota bacterium]|nr:class I SAM-dependent methyltransferase [Bacteroidota bacterium]
MLADRDTEWFANWFDSPYYHTLYKDRNTSEAELFIDQLIAYLHPEPGSRILDLACGKGRHSVYLNKKGFSTIGIDLSKESIACALNSQNPSLQFYVHDMRKPFRTNYFDIVLNLFTSFGYFETSRDDNAVLQAVHKSLRPGGTFVLDFLNIKKTLATLKTTESKTVEGILFKLDKTIENGFLVKKISFHDKGKDHVFFEKVKALTLPDLEKYFSVNKLKIVDLRGDYKLNKFNEDESDRLIIFAKKED